MGICVCVCVYTYIYIYMYMCMMCRYTCHMMSDVSCMINMHICNT